MSQQEQIAAALDHIARGDYPNHCRFDDAMRALAADYEAQAKHNEILAQSNREILAEGERLKSEVESGEKTIAYWCRMYHQVFGQIESLKAELEASQRVAFWAKSEWRDAGKRLEQSLIDESQWKADARELVECTIQGLFYVSSEPLQNRIENALAKIRTWLPEVK